MTQVSTSIAPTAGTQVPVPVAKPGPASADMALLDEATFAQMQRVAIAIGASSLVPRHLKGSTQAETVGNCLRVVNQAYRWGFDPFAVADSSYVVHGKLGYEGKLVAAVVNVKAKIVGRLRYDHTGSGQNRKVVVSATFAGEDEPRTIELTVAQAKTDNDMWTKDPDQKLCYSGAVKWARRHCPEVIHGVLTDDDLEHIKAREDRIIEPAPSTLDDLTDRLQGKLEGPKQPETGGGGTVYSEPPVSKPKQTPKKPVPEAEETAPKQDSQASRMINIQATRDVGELGNLLEDFRGDPDLNDQQFIELEAAVQTRIKKLEVAR